MGLTYACTLLLYIDILRYFDILPSRVSISEIVEAQSISVEPRYVIRGEREGSSNCLTGDLNPETFGYVELPY